MFSFLVLVSSAQVGFFPFSFFDFCSICAGGFVKFGVGREDTLLLLLLLLLLFWEVMISSLGEREEMEISLVTSIT